MYLRYRIIAHELACDLGIDSNCAPLGRCGGGGNTPFPEKPLLRVPIRRQRGTAWAVPWPMACWKAGFCRLLKHIPGHGRAHCADSHLELPDGRCPALDELETVWISLPFRALNGLPMGMTAHLVYDAVDRPAPAATLSPVMMQVIRDQIGFDGLIMTDDISMKALSGSLWRRLRSRGPSTAGCDVVLLCNANA